MADLAIALKKQIDASREKLRHPKGLSRQIGSIVAKDCKEAFDRQRLGDLIWPRRYQGQQPPVINIAGALSDWIAGRSEPKANRFRDVPALVDTYGLRNSIRGIAADDITAKVFTDKPYASLHQEGGTSVQNYGFDTGDRIREWLLTIAGRLRRWVVRHKGSSGVEHKQKTPRGVYDKHIRPLLKRWEWRQTIAARPFIGVTDAAETQIVNAVREHFEKRGYGSSE